MRPIDDPRPAAALQPTRSLHDVRASIDDIDRRIIDLLAARHACALDAARLKSPAALKDPVREDEVISRVTALASKHGLDPTLIEALYREIMSSLLRAERASVSANDPEIRGGTVTPHEPLLPPEEVRERLPLSHRAARTIAEGRRAVEAILDGRDTRLLVVVGPCSVHDPAAALEYARRLRALSAEVSDNLLLVMRVYLEKPRTSIGWEGFTSDPRLDGSFRVAEGVERGRRLMLDVNDLGVPVGSEALDPIAPRYTGDLVSWYAIGARTAESQTHRNLASGLSAPIGIKNATDGRMDPAVSAIVAASRSHAFLGIDDRGRCAAIRTPGNPHGHLVLRGGGGRPNFDKHSVATAERALTRAGLRPRIVVDCSHENSGKDPLVQPIVARDVVSQLRHGNTSIVGLMLESFLVPGNQPIAADLSQLEYGRSVTDPCLGWEETADLLRDLSAGVVAARSGSRA